MAPFYARLAEARARQQTLAAAQHALDTRDNALLVQLWEQLGGHPSGQALANEVNASRERLKATPLLSQALDEERVEDAVRLWNAHQLQGRRIAEHLTQRYAEARKRWIDRVDPRNISVSIRGNNLFIRWDWPEEIRIVAVTVDTAFYPSQVRPIDPRCSREEYERLGGFQLAVPPAQRYFVRLFSIIPEAGLWHASPGLQPTAFASTSRERTVYYEVVKLPDGHAYLKVRSADTSPLPNLLVCARSGSKVLSPEGAQTLARIDEATTEARQGQLTIPLDFSGWSRGVAYVRVFPQDQDPGIRTIGQPADNIEAVIS